MRVYIHGMAFFDIGYLACLTSLTYYSSKVSGFGYQQGQKEIFYDILPTANAFKGQSNIAITYSNITPIQC